MGTDKLRLFIAVDVPLDLRRDLARTLDKKAFGPGRWTDIDGQHVTLKFLGWCQSQALGRIVEIARETASEAAPYQARLSDLGVFPSPRRARVLWAGVEDNGESAALSGALDRRLELLGFSAEDRAFTPHLTLARFKPPIKLERLPPLALGDPSFKVAELALYRSHLSPGGARYEVLERLALGSEGDAGSTPGDEG